MPDSGKADEYEEGDGSGRGDSYVIEGEWLVLCVHENLHTG